MRTVVVLALAAGPIAVSPATALAHTELIDSNPEADAVLEEAPSEIRLTFNESVETHLHHGPHRGGRVRAAGGGSPGRGR